MSVLDTHVLSELIRAQPDAGGLAWLDRQASHALLLTAVTVAQLQYGIERLPEGRRKRALRDAARAMLEQDFQQRRGEKRRAYLHGRPARAPRPIPNPIANPTSDMTNMVILPAMM
ncbi:MULTISPECIES: PIN domain-containing protein [Burkholderiaceae]|uniref:PIN domain-containing protein n=1 Tax=Burkholderiaceae TaxID=119060 RepID=UPI00096912F1|nr:Predicted nucleic acid-binding protein, contains PIN domain [Burkholderia sp. b14]